MTAAALLLAAALAAGPTTLERIALMAIDAEDVGKVELEALYPVLEEALRKRSGACVVSQHTLDLARDNGVDLKTLEVCGKPIREASRVSHVVQANVATLNQDYVFTIKIVDIPATRKISDRSVKLSSHSELLAKLPGIIEELLAGIPKAPPPEP